MTDSTITLEKLQATMRGLPKPPRDPFAIYRGFGGLQIVENPLAVVREEEIETFAGHPILQWLSRLLARVGVRFDPDIHRARVRYRPTAFMVGHKLVMPPSLSAVLKDVCA